LKSGHLNFKNQVLPSKEVQHSFTLPEIKTTSINNQEAGFIQTQLKLLYA